MKNAFAQTEERIIIRSKICFNSENLFKQILQKIEKPGVNLLTPGASLLQPTTKYIT